MVKPEGLLEYTSYQNIHLQNAYNSVPGAKPWKAVKSLQYLKKKKKNATLKILSHQFNISCLIAIDFQAFLSFNNIK